MTQQLRAAASERLDGLLQKEEMIQELRAAAGKRLDALLQKEQIIATLDAELKRLRAQLGASERGR